MSLTAGTLLSGADLAVADPAVAESFHVASLYLPSLPVAVSRLGLSLAPLYFAPCSEMYGRRNMYLFAFILFILLNAGCAMAPNMACLAGLRLLWGMAGSVGPVLEVGTISDMFYVSHRGRAQAICGLWAQAGPVPGRVTGGLLHDAPPGQYGIR